jgi:PAS domain S-box-containing protein
MENQNKSIGILIREIVKQGIIEAIGDAVSIQDLNYKILYQNERAKKIIGSHVGEFCYSAYEKRDTICRDCPVELSLRDGKVRTVERHNPIHKDLVVEITSSAIKDPAGKVIASMEVVRDITERKRLEKQISHAKKEWEDTFDDISEAITIHDTDFNIIRANRAAEELLGLDFSGIFNQKCHKLYHGLDSPPESCPSCRTLKTGIPTITEVFEPNLSKHIEIEAFPRFDKDRRIIGVVHFARDISKRMAMKEEREKLILELEDALAKVKTLKGLLPMCSACSKVRDEKGNWTHVDVYISDHSEAEITHSYCPECAVKHFQNICKKKIR